MVQMGVGEHYGIERSGVEGKRVAVVTLVLGAPLYQPAFHEYTIFADTKQIA
jgi:hypothetical protein